MSEILSARLSAQISMVGVLLVLNPLQDVSDGVNHGESRVGAAKVHADSEGWVYRVGLFHDGLFPV